MRMETPQETRMDEPPRTKVVTDEPPDFTGGRHPHPSKSQSSDEIGLGEKRGEYGPNTQEPTSTPGGSRSETRTKRRRRISKPQKMKSETRKSLGELIIFLRESPSLVSANRQLVVTTLTYLLHLCQAEAIRPLLEDAIMNAENVEGAPTNVLTLQRELNIFHVLHARLARHVDSERGASWQIPLKTPDNFNHTARREALESQLASLWETAQAWITEMDSAFYWGAEVLGHNNLM